MKTKKKSAFSSKKTKPWTTCGWSSSGGSRSSALTASPATRTAPKLATQTRLHPATLLWTQSRSQTPGQGLPARVSRTSCRWFKRSTAHHAIHRRAQEARAVMFHGKATSCLILPPRVPVGNELTVSQTFSSAPYLFLQYRLNAFVSLKLWMKNKVTYNSEMIRVSKLEHHFLCYRIYYFYHKTNKRKTLVLLDKFLTSTKITIFNFFNYYAFATWESFMTFSFFYLPIHLVEPSFYEVIRIIKEWNTFSNW